MRTLVLQRGPEARRWILASLVVGVPVLFLRLMNDPISVPKLALLTVGVTVVLAIRAVEILQGASWHGLTRMWVPAACFVLPLTIAWVLGPYPEWSFLGAYGRYQGFLPYLLVVLLGVLIADAFVGRNRMLGWALLIAGGVVGGYGVIQFVGMDPFDWALGGISNEQVTSTMGNPNFVGGFLGIVLPVGIALYVTEDTRRSVALRLLVLVIAGWLLARSEGGWAAGVAGSAVVLGTWARTRWPLARLAGMVLAGLVALAVIGWVGFSVTRSTVPSPDNTAALRGGWWIAATRMTLDSPIVGRGPDAFAVEGVSYRTTGDALTQRFDYTDDPHSVPFDLLTSGGALLLVGWVFTLAWGFRKGWLFASGSVMPAALLGALVAYTVQSIVSIDQIPLSASLWVVLGGLASFEGPDDALPAKSRKRKTHRPGKKKRALALPLVRPWGVAFVMALVIVPLWWSGRLVLADGRALQARQLFVQDRPMEGATEWRRAIETRTDPLYRHLYGFYVGRAAVEGREELVDEMSEAFSYLSGFPEVAAIRDEGRLLHELGMSEEAAGVYERAVSIDPKNPALRIEAGQVLLDARRYEDVESLLAPYIDRYKPALTEVASVGTAYPDLWLLLSRARFQQGDLAGVKRAIETMIPESNRDGSGVETVRGMVTADDGQPLEEARLAPLWGYLALLEARLGNVPNAHQAITVALALDPEEPDALAAVELVGEPD